MSGPTSLTRSISFRHLADVTGRSAGVFNRQALDISALKDPVGGRNGWDNSSTGDR